MISERIVSLETRDVRFPLESGAGTDAVHSGSEYAFATTLLATPNGMFGTGLALTLGRGNELVCEAAAMLGTSLIGREIEELMADFGAVSRQLAQDPQLRWLGPHKGVVHLALASLTNACFDLWAKTRGLPLWRLLLDLTPRQVVNLLDVSYLEHVLPPEEALKILQEHSGERSAREAVLQEGYPGYDTSVGWFNYEDARVKDLASRALQQGFRAFKLKVGSHEPARDVRRATMLRQVVGPDPLIMLDANQQWTLPTALNICQELNSISPYFIEEPTHPDDIAAHRQLAEVIAPTRIALGEHVANRILFHNFMQAGAVHVVQPDCTRLAGVSEFITVSLLARKLGFPVVPHVGDMGQIHQHLVLFNHIALGHETLFLEYIPHLRQYFVTPARVERGVYVTPRAAGSSSDLAGVAPKTPHHMRMV
jgi:L-fuconate dehydratase